MWWYNLGIATLSTGIRFASMWNQKAKLWSDGRKQIFDRMSSVISPDDKIIWVHSASLGEFEQGRPIIEEIRIRKPEYKILLTFYSPSGFEIRKSYRGADYVFYIPSDLPCHVKRFLDIVHPEVAIFIKYEYWLNFLAELKKRGCRTFIISAIFRPDSIFFKPWGGVFRNALRCFDRIFVQNAESLALLSKIGIDRVTATGDTRFDRVKAIAESTKRLKIIENFVGNDRALLAGSTWGPDEEIIQKLIDSHSDLKFIIAPHELKQERINNIIAANNGHAARYTESTETTDFIGKRVLVIDTIGILSSSYRYASFAYIGGGFGVGIHNTLEAATFSLPIAFGPNYRKFKEATDMVELGVARSISSFEEADSWLTELMSNRKLYEQKCAGAAQYVYDNTGATDKILKFVLE